MKRTSLKAFLDKQHAGPAAPKTSATHPACLHTQGPLCVCVRVYMCVFVDHMHSYIMFMFTYSVVSVCACVFMQPEGINPNYNILLINRVCSRASEGRCCVQLMQQDHTLYK